MIEITGLNIFEFDDYKAWILAADTRLQPHIRGFRTRMAEAMGCQSAFISQVLNGNHHFSLEQAGKLARLFQLKPEQFDYLVLIISMARAGTSELRAYFAAKIAIAQSEHLKIEKSVSVAKVLAGAEQSRYYSRWIYAAIHVLITIPEFRTIEAIAERLQLPKSEVEAALGFLVESGLAKSEGQKFIPGEVGLHLPATSPYIQTHHTSWRMRALDALSRMPGQGMHYSTVSSLSHADAKKLKAELLKVVQRYTETVRDSKEETLMGFNLDFYPLI